jgi:hypothetical protein
MAIQPSQHLVHSLHAALSKLEHGLDPIEDAVVTAEIKRLILVRVAEIEFLNTLVRAAGRANRIPNPSGSRELFEVREEVAR